MMRRRLSNTSPGVEVATKSRRDIQHFIRLHGDDASSCARSRSRMKKKKRPKEKEVLKVHKSSRVNPPDSNFVSPLHFFSFSWEQNKSPHQNVLKWKSRKIKFVGVNKKISENVASCCKINFVYFFTFLASRTIRGKSQFHFWQFSNAISNEGVTKFQTEEREDTSVIIDGFELKYLTMSKWLKVFHLLSRPMLSAEKSWLRPQFHFFTSKLYTRMKTWTLGKRSKSFNF